MGASGSGKTSSVGFLLGKALAASPKVGGLIIASKPEDRAFWRVDFRGGGPGACRLRPGSSHRFNVIDFEAKNGDGRGEITQCIMTIGESLYAGGRRWDATRSGSSRTAAPSTTRWRCSSRRTAGWIRGTSSGSSTTRRCLARKWAARSGRPATTTTRLPQAIRRRQIGHRGRTIINLAQQFWLNEWPCMNDKTRSSILAGVMGLLHFFNTGHCQGTDRHGHHDHARRLRRRGSGSGRHAHRQSRRSGAFVAGGMEIRHAAACAAARPRRRKRPSPCIWIDEYQNHITSFDAKYLAECRSHRGCMVVLTQSMHSLLQRHRRQGGAEPDQGVAYKLRHQMLHGAGR